MPDGQAMAPGDWNQPSQLEGFLDHSGGVRSNVEPYYLEENQLAYLKNGDLDQFGVRRKRLGVDAYGGAGTVPAGIGSWYPFFSDPQKYLVGVWDGQVYRSVIDRQWNRISETSISLVGSTLYNIVEGQCTEYHPAPTDVTLTHNSLFLAAAYPWTGVTQPPLYVVQSDGDSTQLSLCPRAIAWWQGRLWMFNFTQADFGPSTLMWSSILDGWEIDTTNNIEINADDGDEGMAIVPARGSTPRLYLFKKHKIYALDVVWGSGVYIPSSENSLDTTNSRLLLISEDIGCVAPKTVVYTAGSEDSDVFFLAADGFRSLKRVEQDVAGGAGLPISEPIQDVFDRLNWAYAHVAVATVYDHKIFLSIPVDGSTTNNLTVVFDLINKRWVGEHNWGVQDSEAHVDANNEMQLWFQWGVTTGETLAALGYTAAAHVFQGLASGQYYDPSTASIEYEEQTRTYFFKDLGSKKRWNWVEYLFEPATTTATVSIYAKIDELDWALVARKTLTPNYEYPILPARLPWNFEQDARQVERIGLQDAPAGQRIQLKLECSTPAAFGIRNIRLAAWPYPEQWEEA